MLRPPVLRAVAGVGLLVGLLGVPAAGPEDPFVGPAEAGPRGAARRTVRHKAHQLVHKERHIKRDIRRDKRHAAHVKENLQDLRGFLHNTRKPK